MYTNKSLLVIIVLLSLFSCIKAPKGSAEAIRANSLNDSIERKIQLINAKLDAIGKKVGINLDTIKLKETTNETSSYLDSIRSKMHVAYQNAQSETTEPTPLAIKDTTSLCTPCDMEFLVYLDKKEDYSKYDVQVLMCLDDNGVCDDSAEFTTYYNEVVFKVFKKKIKTMSPSDIKEYLKDNELNLEFLNPVIDKNSSSFLDSLKARIKEK
ncbi:hypothetical protein [Kordia sp.]|uniref:hypothetical protein n=1 Tax=Kordia sp. TaxID=1965332 RepID=UPI0025BC08BE|nr:hypothetical protein [Kordia sp.]MCH2193899.1 hypothetical protein [Kordia sp.]